MLSYLPTPTREVSNGIEQLRHASREINDRAMMYTGKVDHRFSDKVSLAGFYLYNKTDEPCANSLVAGPHEPNRFIDRSDYLLHPPRQRAGAEQHLAAGQQHRRSTLRYGWTKFMDQTTRCRSSTTRPQLGFATSFLQPAAGEEVPARQRHRLLRVRRDRSEHRVTGIRGAPTRTMSKLIGSPHLQGRRRLPQRSASTRSRSPAARATSASTASSPRRTRSRPTHDVGQRARELLLGYPSGEPGNRAARVTVSSPFKAYTNYYGVYAAGRLARQPEVHLNYGVRLEHEDGLREENNGFTVAFDRTLNPGGALGAVVNPLTGQPIRGGLVYAGQNGANEYQGDPPAVKFSPRVGMVYSMNPKTVVRAGYGIYWAPWNYQARRRAPTTATSASRRSTQIAAGQFSPTVSLTNPFPNGVARRSATPAARLTGVGSADRVHRSGQEGAEIHQYSVDVARELPGNIAIGFEYVGATGRDLGLGGSNDGIININQVPIRSTWRSARR